MYFSLIYVIVAFQGIKDEKQEDRDLKVKNGKDLKWIWQTKAIHARVCIYTAMCKHTPKDTAVYTAVFAPGLKTQERHGRVSRPCLRRPRNTGTGHARVLARVQQCEHWSESHTWLQQRYTPVWMYTRPCSVKFVNICANFVNMVTE